MAPKESGGVLLGYWANFPNEAVVTNVVGPGPLALHERFRFTPDYEFHYHEIDRLYSTSLRTIQYLGDWHSHPGGTERLSDLDKVTLARIACYKDARAPQPVMLVVSPGPSWSPTAHQGSVKRRILRGCQLSLRQMEVTLF